MVVGGRFIADQLEKAFASDPWHGPATASLLRGLSAESAVARPVDQAHSVWEIVLHITAWQREVLERLEGKEPSLPKDCDWPVVPPPTSPAWTQACLELESSLQQLAQSVRRLGPEDLQVKVGTTRDLALGTGVSRAEMLLGVLQHNAYHSGQVALLRRALAL